jgi:hypothetical protein
MKPATYFSDGAAERTRTRKCRFNPARSGIGLFPASAPRTGASGGAVT